MYVFVFWEQFLYNFDDIFRSVFVKWHILTCCVCILESKSSLNFIRVENYISSFIYGQLGQ